MMDSSTGSELNGTLEDGAWKDSFDKILEPRPVLRERNLLKRDVRASFNIDSSIENSGRSELDTSASLSIPRSRCIANQKDGSNGHHSVISTPVAAARLVFDPFKCSLSPIGAWKLRFFDKVETRKRKIEDGPLHATPINPEIVVVDYDDSQKSNSSILVEGPVVFSPLPLHPRTTAAEVAKRTQSKRHVCFQSVKEEPQKVEESECNSDIIPCRQVKENVATVTLQPGKWRKSFNIWRRNHQQCVDRKSSCVPGEASVIDNSVEFVAHLGVIARHRKSVFLKQERFSGNSMLEAHIQPDDWEKRVLKYCQQETPLPFHETYSAEKLKNCKKIGEGAYGEVFFNAVSKKKFGEGATVLKIIPIEGKVEVNGEVQKTFEQILAEVVISIKLSQLREGKNAANMTPSFVAVKKVACVRGAYPSHFIDLWEEYDEKKGSENDHPNIFCSEQLYVILELEFGGKDLDSFEFANAEQTYHALQQVVLTLAVAEQVFQFEHRDLHWGNILVLNTSLKQLKFKLNDKELVVPTKGIKVTIIDYTLSRLTSDDCCFYNDLSSDEELFSATGDYQFDIYRMMRELLKNDWETFNPRTNIFWISYIISKMIDGVSYKNTRTKLHSLYMNKLQQLKDSVLNYESAVQFAEYLIEQKS